MRTSVRRITASSQTTIGTTRTPTSRPQSRTPMTTLTHCPCTSTDAWRTCTELARIFDPQLVMIHAHLMAQVLSAFTFIHSHPHGLLLDSTSPLSTSSSSSCLSPSSSSTSSCSLSSPTRRAWQTCAAPLQKGVRTP